MRRLEQALHTNYTLIDISIQLGEKTPSCEKIYIQLGEKTPSCERRSRLSDRSMYDLAEICDAWRRFATPGGGLASTGGGLAAPGGGLATPGGGVVKKW